MKPKTPMWRRHLTFWERDIDRDLEDEVRFHIEARTRELIASGWDAGKARDEAVRVFGDPTGVRDQCRRIDSRFEQEKRMAASFENFRHDVRFALRQFRSQPRFWGVVVLTLVVGIAASTSVFAVVDGVLLKPLPYPEPERLVRLTTFNLRGEFALLSERARTMELAAYYPQPREVTLNTGDRAVRVPAAGVTSNLFDLLGATPVLGRAFTAEEMRRDGPGIVGGDFWRTYGVVAVSSAFWRDYLGGRTDVLGATVSIEDVPHTVVGVLPPGFNFPSRGVQLWFPHDINPDDLWSGNVATMIGRLRDGYSLAQARQELVTLAPALRDEIPWGQYVQDYGTDFDVEPLSEAIVGDTRPMFLLVSGAIVAVLLVLSVNVANLLLARGAGRERELATRTALGARRSRLVRQLMVESLLVAGVAGAIGTLVSWGLLRTVLAMLPADLPRLEEIVIDVRMLLFAVAVSTSVGFAFGLLPALRTTRRKHELSPTARGVVGDRGEGRLTSALATLEFAAAIVLVVSAMWLVQSFWNLAAVDPGFDAAQLTTARVSPAGFNERPPAEQGAFTELLATRIQAIPGVESAALANAIPFDRGLFGTSFEADPNPDSGTGNNFIPLYSGVTDTYFEAMRIPVLEGRGFTSADGREGPKVALVSRSLARAYWGGASPVGERIWFQDNRQPGIGPDGDEPRYTVVGVVDDVRFDDLAGEAVPMLYLPLGQFWDLESIRVVMRSPNLTVGTVDALRSIVSELDPTAAVSEVSTYEARLGATIARPRFAAYLLIAFSGIALFMAAVGVYGVLSYALSRRVPEIGVRLAFGASGGQVFRLLFRQGVRLTLAGIALGIPAAIASSRFLSSQLFGVDPMSPTLLGAVAITLLVVGLVVSYVPARRAARIDPMAALRQE